MGEIGLSRRRKKSLKRTHIQSICHHWLTLYWSSHACFTGEQGNLFLRLYVSLLELICVLGLGYRLSTICRPHNFVFLFFHDLKTEMLAFDESFTAERALFLPKRTYNFFLCFFRLLDACSFWRFVVMFQLLSWHYFQYWRWRECVCVFDIEPKEANMMHIISRKFWVRS